MDSILGHNHSDVTFAIIDVSFHGFFCIRHRTKWLSVKAVHQPQLTARHHRVYMVAPLLERPEGKLAFLSLGHQLPVAREETRGKSSIPSLGYQLPHC